MSPKPNYMSWEALESFFEAHKVTRVVHSNSLFEVSYAHFVCEWVSKRKNHSQLTFVAIKKRVWVNPSSDVVTFKLFSRASQDMQFVFGDISRIIPIQQSKRDGRTTRESFFITTNVSWGWFLRLDTHLDPYLRWIWGVNYAILEVHFNFRSPQKVFYGSHQHGMSM